MSGECGSLEADLNARKLHSRFFEEIMESWVNPRIRISIIAIKP